MHSTCTYGVGALGRTCSRRGAMLYCTTVGHGGNSVGEWGWCPPGSPCTWLPGQPHLCSPHSPQ